MEQTPSAVNWRRVNAVKGPGEMRRWSYQAIARGADGVLFFQWRASRAGAEKFHGAVVPHAGPETRIFRECRELGAELRRLDPIVGSRVVAPVGICFDWPTWWAVEGESKPTKFDYPGTFLKFHRALYEGNVGTTCVTPGQDWLAAGLHLVVAPLAYLCTDAMAENVRRFVESGGVFVTTYFSGVADENDRIHLGGYPHPVLREVLGLTVEEWLPQPLGVTLRLRAEGDAGKDIWDDKPRADTWAEIIHPQGAQTLATFRDGWFAGRPAVTCHSFGQGAAYYVGTELVSDDLAALLAAVCQRAEVTAPVKAPPGVEAVIRRAEETGAEFLFLVNGSGAPATVSLRTWRGCTDLLGGNRPDKDLTLPPEGVAILQR